jgi:hypothetical protein
MKDSSMWWQDGKEVLMALCTDSFPLIVYNEETLNDLFFSLLSIDSIDRCFYTVRTNPHPGIIKKAFETGLDFLIGNMEEEKQVKASCPGGLHPTGFALHLKPFHSRISPSGTTLGPPSGVWRVIRRIFSCHPRKQGIFKIIQKRLSGSRKSTRIRNYGSHAVPGSFLTQVSFSRR